MAKIEPTKDYTINEIIKLKLIPGVTTHPQVYNLITNRIKSENKNHKYTNVPTEETTPNKIKPNLNNRPWNKIAGKLTVKGKEIIKFLGFHNL